MYQNDNITSVYQNSTLPDAFDSSPITPKLAIGLGSLLALGLIFAVMCIIMLIIRGRKSHVKPVKLYDSRRRMEATK